MAQTRHLRLTRTFVSRGLRLFREPYRSGRHCSLTVAARVGTAASPSSTVALEAERPHGGRVGGPETAASAPILLELPAGGVVELSLVFAELLGVEAARRADA